MRRTFSIGAILSLTLSSLALAQPPQGQPDQGHQAQGGPTTRPAQGQRPVGHPGGGGPGGSHGGAPGGPGGGPGGGKPSGGPGGPPGGGGPPQHGQRPPTSNPGNRPPITNPGGRPLSVNPGGRPAAQGWRPGGPPNQWRLATGSNWFWHGRTMHRIRAPSFRYPPGYAYRRWTAGSILPRLFLSSLYFYSGWSPLGLPAPPPGYAWVRYGPDLLMVELGTGRIVDVAYGVFL
jgi:hypothetical protein